MLLPICSVFDSTKTSRNGPSGDTLQCLSKSNGGNADTLAEPHTLQRTKKSGTYKSLALALWLRVKLLSSNLWNHELRCMLTCQCHRRPHAMPT